MQPHVRCVCVCRAARAVAAACENGSFIGPTSLRGVLFFFFFLDELARSWELGIEKCCLGICGGAEPS